jgi:type II secretory pathway pseudopilin PulG
MTSRNAEAGFSLLEVSVAMVLTTWLAAVLMGTFQRSTGLANRSTTVLQANEEQRRNLEAIATAMRGAATASLSGFDVTGTATSPTFQNVTGIDDKGLILDVPSTISWRQTTAPVPGVAKPGELVLTRGAQQTVVARRVPFGGFKVVRLGLTLRIDMTTYFAGPNHTLQTVSGQTSLTLRN